MARNMRTFLLMALVLLSLNGCFSKWSLQEKEQFKSECESSQTTDYLSVYFEGFSYAELEKVEVKQVRDGGVIDTFFIYPDIRRFKHENIDELSIMGSATIRQEIYLADSYHFTLSSEQSFVLGEIKMIVWPQYTMFSEGYGCRLGEFSIDGVKSDSGHINFVKKGYKDPLKKAHEEKL